jgi:hypothetical protein
VTPEEIPIEAVERRVLRAIRTLGVLRDRELDWLRVKACWPSTLVEWADLLARAENPDLEERPVRFEPTRADLGDYLLALSWFARLQGSRRIGRGLKAEQRIVHMVAYEWSFEAIGREIGQHHDAIRNRYRKAIQQCWRSANAEYFAAARARAEASFRSQTRP